MGFITWVHGLSFEEKLMKTARQGKSMKIERRDDLKKWKKRNKGRRNKRIKGKKPTTDTGWKNG